MARLLAPSCAALAVTVCVLAGCGPQWGAMRYFLGGVPKQTIPAKFKLTTGPLLILFDDSPAVDLPSDMRDLTVRALIDEFKKQGINEKVVPLSRLNELRQQRRDVNDRGRPRGMREMGRMLDADQVLWLYPKEFAMPTAPEQVLDPAKLTVALKVIDARATESSKLRLWPISEEGELVSITVAPHQVRAKKTPDELLQTMAQDLSVEIGHLFRDYEAPRPEDQKTLAPTD